MVDDHKINSYFEALQDVRGCRRAAARGPPWEAYAASALCRCCAAPFTWASTSSSAAQAIYDRENCRNCGAVVCAPCSTNRVALPKWGMGVVRVCDRCYFGLRTGGGGDG